MEIVISKSTNSKKKFDASVVVKKYHSALWDTKTLQRIKTLNAKSDI